MEDRPDVRDLFALFLPMLGHWVESAGDAGTALEQLCQGGFDVLLTDLWQPNAHGWCLLRELRARGDLPPHVISTSAGVQPEMVRLSQEAGCCAHLEQPFWLLEVEQVLETICLSKEAACAARRCMIADVPGGFIDPTFRAEALRLRTESNLLCAIVARNIAACRQAVEDARKTFAQWQTKSLS